MVFYRKKMVSDEQKELIRSAKSCCEASRLTGFSASWCWQIRRQLGVPLAYKPYTKSDIKQLTELYKGTAVSVRVIAEKMGRSQSSVFRKLKYLREKGKL